MYLQSRDRQLPVPFFLPATWALLEAHERAARMAPAETTITAYLALLRGVNVGGNNKLPMRDLAALFAAAGCGRVRTYIQSGNVVFRASADIAAGLPSLLAAQLAERFNCRTPVILRTAAQVGAVLRTNPYLAPGADENALHVLFLAGVPSAERVAALDPDRSPPDTYQVIGQEIYLHLPQGMGRTKLTNAYFDTKLATISTARNWRTVNALHEMLLDQA